MYTLVYTQTKLKQNDKSPLLKNNQNVTWAFDSFTIYGKIQSTHLNTYFSSYLPLLSYIFRNRIAICPKCFTNFKNLCSCLLSRKKDYKYCFLNLQRSSSLESVQLHQQIQLLVSKNKTSSV